MGGLHVSSNGGIQVDYGDTRYLLDPKGSTSADYAFVSHAHVDHMHRASKSERIIASTATRDLALARGYDLGETLETLEGVDLLDSGHILGSRAIRIDDELLYTGDASGRERAFLGKCRTKTAKVLVMETTYGLPRYVFPPTAKLVRDVNSLIGAAFDKGRPVVLMGYQLGKAQLLSYFFSSWSPLYLHEGVARINDVHRRHGVSLRTGRRFDPANGTEGIPRGPWVMITPMTTGRSRFMAALKKQYGAVLIAFSGWALGEGYCRSLGIDYAFPLSDHCDYPELIKLVQEVSPETVYTTHGFAQEFASDLRKMGFTARTLSAYQSSLYDYVSGD
ncbi:MAG TPA: MBL fold metallo-hydrolase RNA specificity domain-containing protein [Nitrososphaerales archaeon]|nr:MBL fold metallo-hydrolase RNA specificity domain-containing protein [Nitrososphaerales archaeon]